ncbi:MAG: hypothetical protein AAGF27_01075 [Pseudomonadota bacterium]
MSDAFLINASTEGMKPLGTAAQRSFELVSDTVRTRLTEAHAALFAEPVPTQFGDRFDWYSSATGRPVLLSEAADPDSARRVLSQLLADIQREADVLLSSNLTEDQRLGEALANALEFPDDQSIYVIEGAGDTQPQPVLVNWAWSRDAPVSVRGALSGMDTRQAPLRPEPVTTAHAGPTATASGLSWWWLLWLGWGVLALLLAAIIALLIEPCGLRIAWLPNSCAQAEAKTDPLADARKLLEDQIALVQKEIAIKDRLCQPDLAQLPIPEPPAPLPTASGVQPSLPVDPEVDRRAQAAGAQRGDLTFTLIWEGPDDLDLHTTCPRGETLFFLDKIGCNGVMDLDMNSFQVVPEPVENVFFTNPLVGDYRVRVNLYRKRGAAGPVPFILQIRDGDQITTQKGTVSAGAQNWQYTYRHEGR